MSYLTQDEIATSESMAARVAQAAAEDGGLPVDPVTALAMNPDKWTNEHRRLWGAAPGWDDAWESAKVAHPESEYDPGADEAVVTDGMILAQVQAMLTS